MPRFITSMRRLIDILFLFLRRLLDILFFYFDIFLRRYMDVLFFSFMTFSRCLFSIWHLFVHIGRVQQNVYFTTVEINFFCWSNLISGNLFKQLQNKRFTEYDHYCYIARNYFILNNTLFIYLYLFIILYITVSVQRAYNKCKKMCWKTFKIIQL